MYIMKKKKLKILLKFLILITYPIIIMKNMSKQTLPIIFFFCTLIDSSKKAQKRTYSTD